ncbi:hypothetical protein FRC07_002040 [Ceratobasidium sp. 392]|nr:hypothetical protein FRC07_002040 [Ceratobasidium sp. 392]
MSRSGYRWDYYRRDLRKAPLDDLNNWEGRAKAKVDWAMDNYRERDNTVVHTATPFVSCDQYHEVKDDMMPHLRRVCDHPYNAYQIIEQALIAWLRPSGQALLKFTHRESYDSRGQYIVWITDYTSRLEHLPIQSCQGRGRSAKEAKHQAAQLLLDSYHCMIHLPRETTR